MASAAVKSGPVPTSGRRASAGPSRGVWFGAALALFLVVSSVALRQEPRPDPGRAIGPLHGEWWLSPLEPAAERRLLQIDADLNQVFALGGTSHVWVVGNGGLILHSADSGRTWARQRLVPEDRAASEPEPSPAPEPATVSWRGLLPPHPLEGVLLVALAVEPPLGSTRNPDARGEAIRQPQMRQGPVNETPAPVPPRPPALAALVHADLLSVHFVDGKNGWVAGRGGALFSTADGGATWTFRDPGTGDAEHVSVRFRSPAEGSLQGDYPATLWTGDGGATWSFEDPRNVTGFLGLPDPAAFLDVVPWAGWRSICVARDRQLAWMTDAGGQVLLFTGDRSAWTGMAEAPTGVPVDLVALDCREDGAVWAVGSSGTLVRRRGEDSTFVPTPTGTSADLRSVSFADAGRGYISGAGGTLLASSDGGATWTPLSRRPDGTAAGPHWVFPAPWYYASLLLVGLVLAPAFRRPVVVAPERSVADLLVSDRPIEAGDPDPLDFTAVALGLSRFLRNEKTQPPLTLAVTGEWGSGKSSLMNLLRADLRRYGFRPVWFNAWHHQKEEHLLASLLEAVRAQAVPSRWRPEGMLFRLKLLGIRGVRVWPLLAVLLLAFAVSLGYLHADPGRLAAAQAALASLADKATDPVGAFSDWTASRSSPQAAPSPAPEGPPASNEPPAPDAPAGWCAAWGSPSRTSPTSCSTPRTAAARSTPGGGASSSPSSTWRS